MSLENVGFSNDMISVTLSWSNGQTTIGNLEAVESVSCYHRYSLQEEDQKGAVVVTGCKGTMMEMQLNSVKYGQVLCQIQPDGSFEIMEIEPAEQEFTTAIENPDFESEFPDRELSMMGLQLPTDLELEVVLYLSPSFREKAKELGYSDETVLAKQVFHHTAIAFLDDSWGYTKILLKPLYIPLLVESDSLDVWRLIVPEKQQKVGRLHSLLIGEGSIGTGCGSNGDASVTGIAFLSSLCGK